MQTLLQVSTYHQLPEILLDRLMAQGCSFYMAVGDTEICAVGAVVLAHQILISIIDTPLSSLIR